MSTHLVLIGAAGFISIGMFRLTDPLLPAIADEFGTTVGNVAMTITAFTVGYGLLQLTYGPLGDRVGKLRVMAAGLLLMALSTAACAWTDSVTSLAVLRFLSGVTAGAIAPLALAHIGDTVPYETRQATIGHFLAATMMGQIVGGSLAGMFAEFFGWRLAFIAFGIAGVAVAARLAVVAIRAPLPRASGARPAGITHLIMLRQLNTRLVWGVVLLEGCFVLGAVPFAGAALKHTFGLDYLTIGLVLAGFGIGGIVYSVCVRWLIATLGELGMIATGGALITASYAVIAFTPLWQVYVPALALIGCGFFCMHGTLQIRGTELAPQARGTAMSGFSFCLFVGQGLGVFLLSLVVDGPGYVTAFAISAAAVALIAAALYALVATRTLRH